MLLPSRLTDTVRVEPSRWLRPGLGDETERGQNELEPLHRKFSQNGGCPTGIRGYLERLHGAGRDVGSFCKQVRFALEPDTPGPHQEREHLRSAPSTKSSRRRAASLTENEAITYAQDPPNKEIALITPSGSFYITATKTLACRTEAGHLECTQLPQSLAATMTSVKNAFAPGNIESAVGDVTNRGQRSWLYAVVLLAELWLDGAREVGDPVRL